MPQQLADECLQLASGTVGQGKDTLRGSEIGWLMKVQRPETAVPLGGSMRAVLVMKGGIKKRKRLRIPDLMHEPGRPVAWEVREGYKAQAPAHCDRRLHLLSL